MLSWSTCKNKLYCREFDLQKFGKDYFLVSNYLFT